MRLRSVTSWAIGPAALSAEHQSNRAERHERGEVLRKQIAQHRERRTHRKPGAVKQGSHNKHCGAYQVGQKSFHTNLHMHRNSPVICVAFFFIWHAPFRLVSRFRSGKLAVRIGSSRAQKFFDRWIHLRVSRPSQPQSCARLPSRGTRRSCHGWCHLT